MGVMRRCLLAVAIAGLVAACTGTASPGPSGAPAPGGSGIPESTPSPSATGQPTLTIVPSPSGGPGATSGGTGVSSPGVSSPGVIVTIVPGTSGPPPPRTPPPSAAPIEFVGLRYRLVDQLGRPLFCDPDMYPVARADEQELAEQRYPGIRADAPTYRAITAHLGIDPTATPSASQVLAIYREWKMLNALVLQPAAGGHAFDFVAASAPGANEGWHVSGTIADDGTIAVATREASGPPPCPICLARGTRIATPLGALPVEVLRAGMPVWTADAAGHRIQAAIRVVGSTPVPPTHLVVRLVLAGGRTLDASPGHPLPDGRRLGDLRPGDVVDGSLVLAADLVPYAGGATFDLLPTGPTGTYWADGVLLASTLRGSGEASAIMAARWPATPRSARPA